MKSLIQAAIVSFLAGFFIFTLSFWLTGCSSAAPDTSTTTWYCTMPNGGVLTLAPAPGVVVRATADGRLYGNKGTESISLPLSSCVSVTRQ